MSSTTPSATTLSRAQGLMVGLAAGDRNKGPTRMMLALAETLVDDEGEYIPEHVVLAYVRWWNNGLGPDAWDTGPTSRSVLENVWDLLRANGSLARDGKWCDDGEVGGAKSKKKKEEPGGKRQKEGVLEMVVEEEDEEEEEVEEEEVEWDEEWVKKRKGKKVGKRTVGEEREQGKEKEEEEKEEKKEKEEKEEEEEEEKKKKREEDGSNEEVSSHRSLTLAAIEGFARMLDRRLGGQTGGVNAVHRCAALALLPPHILREGSKSSGGGGVECSSGGERVDSSGARSGTDAGSQSQAAGLSLSPEDKGLVSMAKQESRCTHWCSASQEACAAYLYLARMLVVGLPWESALDALFHNHAEVFPNVARDLIPLLSKATGRPPLATTSSTSPPPPSTPLPPLPPPPPPSSPPRPSPPQDTGYCLHTLAAAIYFVHTHSSFSSALTAAVKYAGPSNYCPVLVGALAGARHGREGIVDRKDLAHWTRSAEGDMVVRRCERSAKMLWGMWEIK